MPPWETRATPKRPLESKSVTDSVASDTATPSTVSKKRKVDWATIDDKELFHGFTLHAPKIRATKRSGSADKKQKTRKSIVGGPAVGGSDVFNRDAPLDAEIVQKNPFAESSLSETHYLVKPAAEWESTLRYRKFTISEAEFEVGQTIFVSKTPEEQDADSAIQHWIGRVLEVRAGDAAHVYLRVYWLYRPEDLPGGRQPYHAESELIASNHMDIIEALSVMDKASVMHWDEDMDKPWPGKEQLFWRQTFDVGRRKGQQLSSLRTVCVDKAPCNPDEGLIQCPSCSEWLHAHCLEERAVEDAQTENGISIKKTKGARKSSAVVEITARFTTLGETGPTYLTVKDVRPEHDNKRWNVDIKCLMCNELIEKAAEELPLEAAPAANNIDLLSREAAEAKEVEVDLATGKEEEEEEKVAAPLAEPGESTVEPSPV